MVKPTSSRVVDKFDVSPSDLNQAIFRVIVVTAVVGWSFYSVNGLPAEQIFRTGHFLFALAYWTISALILLWTKLIVTNAPLSSAVYPATRTAGIFVDVTAASFYTAISNEACIILYPIYLTMSIGYGYRFGVRYLYLALVVSAVSFSLAIPYNEYILQNTSMIWAYYIGIALVPLYSASLLNKHREVLDRIRDVNLARSRFIANMSHELRTPLHAIISVADLLNEESDHKSATGQTIGKKLRMISDSAHHLLDLVNRVLDIASADAGGVGKVSKLPFKLVDPVCSSLRICQPNAESKGIGFHWYYDSRLPITLLGSSDYVQEILINTVGNAIKYTPSGYVHVSIRLASSAETPQLNIEIHDTGVGISTKLLPTIFEPFTLGDDSAARDFSGTGLGLTLTKQFVDNLGGTIEFESSEGSGTECRISIPIDAVNHLGPHSEQNQIDAECLLVTPRVIRRSELAQFERARFVLRVSDKDSLVSYCGSDVVAVFIDSLYSNSVDRILETLGLRGNQALIVYYDSEGQGPRHERIEFNTTVEVSNFEQLNRAKNLALKLFAAVDSKPEYDKEEFERLGISDVLIADDNPTNLTTAKLALEACGLRVVIANSGENALAALDEESFNLALIDLHMPQMSGLEVIQIYQYLFTESRTPIVILTADATNAARTEAIAAGAVEVLTKPLGVAELRQAVLEFSTKNRDGQIIEHLKSVGESKDPSTGDALIDDTVITEFLELGIDKRELLQMLSEFIADGKELLNQYAIGQTENDLEKVRDTLHSLKGACGTVGATKLFNLLNDPSSKGSQSWEVRHKEFLVLLGESEEAIRNEINNWSNA